MNIFKQAIILLLILMFALTGCNRGKNQGKVKPQDNPDTPISQEKNDEQDVKESDSKLVDDEKNQNNPKEEPSSIEEDGEAVFEIQESKKIDGWKQLIFKDQSYSTTDWESYSFEEDSPMVAYSIHFPGEWELEYSVFHNEKNEKVAELFPPIVMKPEQKLLDNWQNQAESELISKKEIKVGNLTGIKIISKVYPSDGDISEWYPHTYYLTDGKQVFAMTFYDMEEGSGSEDLYDKVIKTFEFR